MHMSTTAIKQHEQILQSILNISIYFRIINLKLNLLSGNYVYIGSSNDLSATLLCTYAKHIINWLLTYSEYNFIYCFGKVHFFHCLKAKRPLSFFVSSNLDFCKNWNNWYSANKG